jgi:anti-sigma B factor antagonist
MVIVVTARRGEALMIVDDIRCLPERGLNVRRRSCATGVVVHAAGEIDMDNVSTLTEALTAAAASVAGGATVVVDLRNVTFFGSSGLTALLVCRRECASRDVALRVVAGDALVLRTIQVTSLHRVLDLRPDVEAALSAA